jgi:hypothetical protein
MYNKFKEMGMSKSCKFILVAFLIIAGLILLFPFINQLIITKNDLAYTYGITNEEKSALVIENDSIFYIIDVKLTGDYEKTWKNLIEKEGKKVFEINPGDYSLSIHYSDHKSLDDLYHLEWYISSRETSGFSVSKGRAVVYSLKGGKVFGFTYTPPSLVKK